MKKAAEIATQLGGDYNLITSKGKSATQSVFHFHVHLVPKKKAMDLIFHGRTILMVKL